MVWQTILVILCLVGIYFLYSNGYLVVQSKSAATFIGSFSGGKNHCGFTFTRCSGRVYRVLKVKERGNYRFDLDAKLSKGTVRFQVLNAKKLPLLTLDPDLRRGRVVLEPKQRYFVQMQFVQASGDCRAVWEKEETAE